jgi:hypothetical protein
MKRLDGRRPTKRLALLAVLVAALLALAGPSDAQVLYGSVVGNVVDTSQAAVAGATVVLVNVDTNLARETTTRGDGSYSLVNVLPGTYRVRVTLQGFKEYVKERVPVSANTVARVDVALEVGAITEAITVESERALLQTDSGDLHGELKSKEIENLPLGNYRNYQSLLNLVPGTTPAGFQNAITDTPARALTTNVNGTARNNNNTRLDGTTNVYIWLPHHSVYVAPAETIDTVNISTASFDAEQGMAGGAAVTVLTKSGTNEFHGSGFWLHEDETLRARNFFNKGDKPDTSRNIGGATLGGPIVKDKLFFFGAWEGHYTTEPSTRTGTVPTAAMRAGDFSAFGTTLYDPATGSGIGTGRTPFPNNVIPADRISPISQELQSRLPMPNRPGTTGNYTDTGLVDFNRDNFDFKLNYNVSSEAQVWAKYSQMNATVYSDMWLGNPPDGGAGGYGFGVGSGTGDTKVKLGTLGLTWTVSPSLIVDGTVGATRFDQEVLPPDFGVNYGTDVFGIPGTNGDGGSNGDPRTSGMPAFVITGFEPFGGIDGWSPIFRNDRSYNVSANATWVKSKHEMRFGVDVVRLELNHWQPELGAGRRRDRAGAHGRPQPVQRLRPVPARALLERGQEHTVRAHDRARVAVRDLLPRPLAGHEGPDPHPGPALGEVPALEARRPRDRVLRRRHEQGAPGRPRRESRGPRHRGQAPAIPAPDRLLLPYGGEQRVPRRVRHHREPHALLAAAARLLPAGDRPGLPGDQQLRARGKLRGRPAALLRTRPEHGRGRPAHDRPHGLALRRRDQPRLHPVLERDLRAPAALGHVARHELRGHGDHPPARLLQHQRRRSR